jgi:hypothetical protein
MPLALRNDEKRVIEAALEFANLRKIKSTRQVEAMFAALPQVPGKFKVIPAKHVTAYMENDQPQLRGWLTALCISAGTKREQVETEVREQLGTVDSFLTFENGRIIQRYALTGVRACYTFAVALLLDESNKLTKRLRQCGAPGCGRFNLDFNPTGRPRRFCNEDHRRAVDALTAADRVRRYREREKKRS